MNNTSHISKIEIESLLTQDSYYRKLEKWPLLTSKDIFPIYKNNREVIDCFATEPYREFYNSNSKDMLTNINGNMEDSFIGISSLLEKFKGKLVVCGGAVIQALFLYDENFYYTSSDVDIFFYDLTIEEANILRIKAIEFLISIFKENAINTYYIKRNEYTTTLCILVNNQYNTGTKIVEYQFIHRIYPDISSIIGGFDLSICMVAYDGKEVYNYILLKI